MTELKPDTLAFTRQADGVQIALLKPPLHRRSPRLLREACLGAAVLMGVASLPPLLLALAGHAWAKPALLVPFLALPGAAVLVSTEINWEREAAVLEITKGYLTFVRTGSEIPRQWATSDLAGVRAVPVGPAWELHIEARGAPAYRALRGRSRIELQFAAGLLRAALAPPRPTPERAVLAPGGECQVCGSPMAEGVVLCATCRTPHHEECWVYNGACSTYGCRQIRFVRPA